MCPALDEIILPDTLKSIGEYAFSYCEFKNIILPDGLVSIGEYCFTSSKLTDIIIPEGVKTIGKYAFLRCEQLESVKFDNCTADVSANMFENCKNLSNVTFGNGISNLKRAIFYNFYVALYFGKSYFCVIQKSVFPDNFYRQTVMFRRNNYIIFGTAVTSYGVVSFVR